MSALKQNDKLVRQGFKDRSWCCARFRCHWKLARGCRRSWHRRIVWRQAPRWSPQCPKESCKAQQKSPQWPSERRKAPQWPPQRASLKFFEMHRYFVFLSHFCNSISTGPPVTPQMKSFRLRQCESWRSFTPRRAPPPAGRPPGQSSRARSQQPHQWSRPQ